MTPRLLFSHPCCLCAPLLLLACGGEQGERVNYEYADLDVPKDPCDAIDGYQILESHLSECPKGEACLWMVDSFEAAIADNGYVSADDSAPGEECDPDDGEYCSDGRRCEDDTATDGVFRCSPWVSDTITQVLPKVRCAGTDYESTKGLHLETRGRSGWGMSFGNSFSFHAGAGNQLVDATNWDGIAMWVKLGDPKGAEAPLPKLHAVSVLAQVREKHTASNPCQFAEYPPGSPQCDELLSDLNLRDQDPNDGEDPISECWESSDNDSDLCDRFARGVGIGTEWRWVRFRFDSMTQGGYGWPASCLSREDLIGMAFDFQDSPAVDVWLDDIALYKDPAIKGDDPPRTKLCDLED